jgi:hypothetical protein
VATGGGGEAEDDGGDDRRRACRPGGRGDEGSRAVSDQSLGTRVATVE